MTEELKVRTANNEMTLGQISDTLPDTETIMTRVGECWWKLWYAAEGGNWGLADYYMRRVIKLENQLKILRPKHLERLERFQASATPAVAAAIEAEDRDAFRTAYQVATDTANRLHEESGYPYIRWTLPKEAPIGLELGPVSPMDPEPTA